ncbi:hypothetical protein H2204_009965 [Knufia peltigerae]|uniref:FAD-binding domain-containing protein n=1 Tax=Knufia peltigerae TaxID=1002370 RepID=A0AA39CT81_9EURO|nr:hypothetical protein H2204_009965 [Knufia peltigerae]
MATTKPIIIIGFGPVGSLLSLLLAQKGIPSTVLEILPSYPDEPRAVGLFGPSHFVFQDAGIYDEVARQADSATGLCYRKRAVDDGKGSQRFGDIIAAAVLVDGTSGPPKPGDHYFLLPQAKLVTICAAKLKSDPTLDSLVDVKLGFKFLSSRETENGVEVTAESVDGTTHVFEGSYLVAADGSRSSVRKQLGLKLYGYSWPERLIASDLIRTVDHVDKLPGIIVVDQVYWGVVTPLEPITPGKPGLWRVSVAITDSSIPYEKLDDEEFVVEQIRRQLDGPKDQPFHLIRHRPYKMHQLLCSTMRKGRTFLSGDAAHINNPIGGLGLNTGILDADALAQTFVRVLKEGSPESLFDRYSLERRRVFQTIVDPISTANKRRIHDSHPDTVAKEDWFYASINNKEDPTEKFQHFEWMKGWRTDMSRF